MAANLNSTLLENRHCLYNGLRERFTLKRQKLKTRPYSARFFRSGSTTTQRWRGSDINVTRQPTSTYRGRGLKGTTAWLCWPFSLFFFFLLLLFFFSFFPSAKRNSCNFLASRGSAASAFSNWKQSRNLLTRVHSLSTIVARPRWFVDGQKEMDERRGYKLGTSTIGFENLCGGNWKKSWKISNGYCWGILGGGGVKLSRQVWMVWFFVRIRSSFIYLSLFSIQRF